MQEQTSFGLGNDGRANESPLSSSSEQAENETAANIAATIRNNFFIVAIKFRLSLQHHRDG